jgi:hypothetical protein
MAERQAESQHEQEYPMNLLRRMLIATSMVAVCTLCSPALYASPASVLHPVPAFFGKAKNVQLSLRNATSSDIELRAGDTVMKLEAGKTMRVNLPAGTRVTTNTATAAHPVGDLLFEVSPSLSGATIAIS